MANRSALQAYLRRLALCCLAALVLVALINEGAYYFLRDEDDRAPRTVELVIPRGTAERVAAGEADPGLPARMTLVLGDVLVVRNEDLVDHQIGPVWVPPGTSASLVMEQADQLAFACSFQPSRYLGVDVRAPTTFGTRLTALGLAAPPTAAFLFVYSLLLLPIGGEQGKPVEGAQAARATLADRERGR